jgi:hypothetical protein
MERTRTAFAILAITFGVAAMPLPFAAEPATDPTAPTPSPKVKGHRPGAGSPGAKDTANCPAFMRHGMRSSLKAGYTIDNLGFRAAKDLDPE